MKNKTITGLWKISPGENADGWEDCLRNGTIGIGWAHKKDLHGLTKEEIVEYTRENYAARERTYIANQLIDFIFNIRKGHIIVAYSRPSTIYGIGVVEKKKWKYNKKVSSDTYWLRNTRKVKWIQPFAEMKIDDAKIISILGKWQTIIPIPKQFCVKKLLPLLPEKSKIEVYESFIQLEAEQNIYSSVEEDEQWIPDESIEEKKRLRHHKFVERNLNLSKKAKEIHGYTCTACGFNFEERYGEIGINYIEAHHRIPFAKLEKNAKVSPKNDMIVLCANCHRMIHKFNNTLDIKEFKKRIR